jgi:pantetheine-phosphate adenylyltransferase
MSDIELNPRIAVYPGTFDPITLGHLNVMERTAKLFDRLIVGVGVHMEKKPWFSAKDRLEQVRMSTAHIPNVEIKTFSGLTVDFVRSCGAKVIVRGVRPITDIPAELTMMMANRTLAPDVETVFLIADGELAHVSSSLIKQIASASGVEQLTQFLPAPVIEHCLETFQAKASGTAKTANND